MATRGSDRTRRRVDRVVVDTSVVSYLLKEHSLAAPYRDLLAGSILALSFMSLAELYRWPLERGWGKRRLEVLTEHLRSYVILNSDAEMPGSSAPSKG